MKTDLQKSQSVRCRFRLLCLVALIGVWQPGLLPAQAQKSVSFPPLGTPLEKLKPLPSGPGLVVCEPVMLKSSPDVADFGAGCSRWLQLVIGGQGELGKTPLWPELSRAEQELNRQDLRLTLVEAGKLSGMLGITHVALGTIQGTPSHCQLTYRLYRLPSRTPLGPPLLAEGSEAQALARLPVMAQRLARALGVTSPRMPPHVEGSEADMATLGHLAEQADALYSSDQYQQLAAMSRHIPLASMILLNSYCLDSTQDNALSAAAAQSLVQQAPDNVQVFGMVGWHSAQLLLTDESLLHALMQRFPNNATLAVAEETLKWTLHDYPAMLRAAERFVLADPASPYAWLVLGRSYSSIADSVRNAVTWEQMTQQQQTYVQRVYPRSRKAVQRATQLDPLYGRAWEELAVAATFAGANQIADKAFWKATRQDKDDTTLYWWGLEMYQPKWTDDKAKLVRVADLAAANTFSTPNKTNAVAGTLWNDGFHKQADMLYARAITEYRTWLTHAPNYRDLHYQLYTVLLHLGKLQEAATEAETLVRLFPNETFSHSNLGFVYYQMKRYDDSIAQYRESLRLNPNAGGAHTYIGFDLVEKGQLREAERELREGLALNSSDSAAHIGLGDVFWRQHQNEEAIKEYQETVRLNPSSPDVYRRLSMVLADNKQFNSALEAGKKALEINPNDAGAHDALGWAFYNLKDLDESIAEFREAIRLNPNDAMAHDDLGGALADKGQLEEAKAEWRITIKLGVSPYAEDARDLLKKHS